MSLRRHRLRALAADLDRSLGALGLDRSHPAYDGWLDPAGLADALGGGGTVLLRVHPEMGAAEEGYAPTPKPPAWVCLDAEGGSLRIASQGADAAPRFASTELVVDVAGPSSGPDGRPRRRGGKWTATLVVVTPASRLRVAETIADRERVAREALEPLEEALRRRLRPVPGSSGPSLAPEERASSTPRAGRPEAARAPLSAEALATWSLRREGDLWVLRDYSSFGPREAAPREWVGFGLMLAGAGACWAMGARMAAAAAGESAAVWLVTAAVLSTMSFAMFHIARHSSRYQERSEALMFLGASQFVVAPWVSRVGAVDDKPEGSYGKALRMRELTRVAVARIGRGFTLRLETTHGPMDVGALEREDVTARWRDVLLRVAAGVAKGSVPAVSSVPPTATPPSPPSRPARVETPSSSDGGAPPPPPPPSAALALVVASVVAGCAATTNSPAPTTTRRGPPTVLTTSSSTPPAATVLASGHPVGSPPAETPPPRPPPLENDWNKAMGEARAQGKLLFVEVWAPWCHTCLSMKSFVLRDPAVAALGDEVVFAALDSDRPENADFLERYPVHTWPTLFVLDPSARAPEEAVLGLWLGAASVGEVRSLVRHAGDVRRAATRPDGPEAMLVRAKRAYAEGRYDDAQRAYERAAATGGTEWRRRSEALFGLLQSTYRAGRFRACAERGVAHAASIEGAATPTDFSRTLLRCAREDGVPVGLTRRARAAARARLEAYVADVPAGASVDDRSDALAVLADELAADGQQAGARLLWERQIALLENAAAAAPGPEVAATFDYARMNTYVHLKRVEEAIALLTRRAEQLPDRYEPPARLAQLLMKIDRPAEARAPLQRAIALSYGPRQLKYLHRRIDLEHAVSPPDPDALAAARVAFLTAYDALDPARRRPFDARAQRIRAAAPGGR
ncbi:MAG: thioredoxin family protein [Myxococcota bacterium]